VTNFEVVEGFQTSDGLNKEMPNLFFCVFGFVLLVFFNCLEKITVVADLHDDAKVARLILEECFFITDDIRVAD